MVHKLTFGDPSCIGKMMTPFQYLKFFTQSNSAVCVWFFKQYIGISVSVKDIYLSTDDLELDDFYDPQV